MKRVLTTAAGVAVTALMAGCGAAGSNQAEAASVYKDGKETVAVMPLDALSIATGTLSTLVKETPVIVEAKMVNGIANATEVQPDPNAEGVRPGDGKDIYGAIDFEVTSVVKGDPAMKGVRVVYLSGKRDADEHDKRIAYTSEDLAYLQLPDGRLRSSAEMAGRTLTLFLKPSTLPVPGYELAFPGGVAEKNPSGALRFSSPTGLPPISAAANPQVAATAQAVTTNEVATAAKQ